LIYLFEIKMKLKFKHQKFQLDAANAVCDVFAGQPYQAENPYLIDQGDVKGQTSITDFTGFRNSRVVSELTDSIVLGNIQRIQRKSLLEPSKKLEGKYNLTIEMETGTGKTYSYIKTMFELNKRYGWSKFIVVVPSIAIREGVYKSFEITQEHFAEEYNKKIKFFIYNSADLPKIDHFASDNTLSVMIINTQAFNASGKDARRITMKLDSFRSRRPMDVIAKTNPIIIIDEPQKVEGVNTKIKMKDFNPLFTLRYSATHKKDALYNMIYRLDAMEAYNKRLVKKIAVKGITSTGTTATEGYIYLEGVNIFKDKNPTANLGFEIKQSTTFKQKVRQVFFGYNLYDKSGELEQYRNGYIVSDIDARDNSLMFQNGIKIYAGDVMGAVNLDQLRRVQIRETILSHVEKERQLFGKGIKVLSLFFIDEVACYKQYEGNQAYNGKYADMFEEEYEDIVSNLEPELFDGDYLKYLDASTAHTVHAGYFSIDKNKHFVESKLERKSNESNDVDAYDLIMKDKERLLSFQEPVRFIFSHSALREGWDNPNVFQICTLKQSSSEVGKRQEVGRGLRLCVNQLGDRMDTATLGEEVHQVNMLTVIASESYESFAKGLQTELAEMVGDRPLKVTVNLFEGRSFENELGETQCIDTDSAELIFESLISNGYIKGGSLTDKYYEHKDREAVDIGEDLSVPKQTVLNILDSIYDPKRMMPEDVRKNNIELKLDKNKFARNDFQELWKRINIKSAYVVDFDTDELIQKAIHKLDSELRVSKIFLKVTTGSMTTIKSKEALQEGTAFKVTDTHHEKLELSTTNKVKYDLVGKVVEDTGLTRATVVKILAGMQPAVFDQFKFNPEEFILKASGLINEEKATVIIQHITYNKLEDTFGNDIFTEPTMKGKLGENAIAVEKHLYDYLLFDSPKTERPFAEALETSEEVSIYVKLPKGFYISTPVGRYNPDWAIAFNKGTVKHIYFVAETKGSLSKMDLRLIEGAKIHCAREHFKAISTNEVKYDVVNSYADLMNLVK